MLKFTDKVNSADEYSNLGAAILKVKESNDSINEKKRQDENMKKIIDIQNAITNETLVRLQRSFSFFLSFILSEAHLCVVCRHCSSPGACSFARAPWRNPTRPARRHAHSPGRKNVGAGDYLAFLLPNT